MRTTDARVKLLTAKVDAVVDHLLNLNLDDDIDALDHYLLGTLRQPNVDVNVFNKVTYYVNNVISNLCPNFKW